MGTLTAYSVAVAMILAIEYIVYKCLLSNATFYRFNRVVLLSCYLIALVAIPLIHFFTNGDALLLASDEMAGDATAAMASGDTPNAVAEAVDVAPVGQPSAIYRAMPVIYFAGMAIMAVVTILSYIKMARIIARGDKREIDGAILVICNAKVSPFSWGKYLVVSPADANNPLIINHELIHIRNRHSLDLLFGRLFVIFNWFNPAAYLMCRELSAVHEYDVDREILLGGVKASDYQMLLIRKTVGPGFQSIANSLNHSQLKNRLTMMLKAKSRGARYLCAAALLPAALLAAAMTDFPAVASTLDNVAAVSYDKVNENSVSRQITESAQPAETPAPEASAPFKTAEKMPQYPGGDRAILEAIMSTIKYPEDQVKAGNVGMTILRFVVTAEGKIDDIQVVRSSGSAELDKEAIRAVKEGVTATWEPGTVGGKPVNVYYTIPVRFATK